MLDYINLIKTPEDQEEYIIDILNVCKGSIAIGVIDVEDYFIGISTVDDLEQKRIPAEDVRGR